MVAAGIPLSTFVPGALRKVPVHLDRRPDRTFDLAERLGDGAARWIEDRYEEGSGVRVADVARAMPMSVHARLTLDELCKVRFSTPFMMESSVEEAFETLPGHLVFDKVRNSVWRWGGGRPGWNEIVDACEGIRGFSFGHPAFEATLDHTRPMNECGYSEHSRTYLDGVFGFLVHHRGEHVMTLGFSVMRGRRILIQQVQLKSRRGNRWLFRLPGNYLEHVIERFRAAFPRHRLLMADGGDMVARSVRSYRSALADAERRRDKAEAVLSRPGADCDGFYAGVRERAEAEAVRLRGCVAHAEAEAPRIAAFYAATGRFRRGGAVTVNGLRHYALAAA